MVLIIYQVALVSPACPSCSKRRRS